MDPTAGLCYMVRFGLKGLVLRHMPFEGLHLHTKG
jgi:hypothetical protein